MTGDRYRLPVVRGGGEVTLVRRDSYNQLTGEPTAVVATGDGTPLVVRECDLTKLEQPLPPEPPPGSVVRDTRDGSVFERGAGDIWFRRELNSNLTYTWANLCVYDGTPVRLVPDPAVGVELPWESGAFEPNITRTSVNEVNGTVHDENHVGPSRVGMVVMLHRPVDARAKAAALLAAADAAEAVTP